MTSSEEVSLDFIVGWIFECRDLLPVSPDSIPRRALRSECEKKLSYGKKKCPIILPGQRTTLESRGGLLGLETCSANNDKEEEAGAGIKIHREGAFPSGNQKIAPRPPSHVRGESSLT